MKFYLTYFQFVLISIILIGCGDVPNENDNSTSSQNLSRSNLSISSQAISFISNHENVLGYGAVNLSAIINNGYYNTDLNKLSFLDYDRLKDSINNQRIRRGMAPISRDEFNAKIDPIRNIFNQFEGKFIHHININEPIYFLCIGENVNDFEFIIFGAFNDREGFLKELKTNEYIDGDLKSKIFRDYKGLKIHYDRDWAFAFSKDKFVFSFNDNNPISLSQFEKHFNAFQGVKKSSVNLSLHDNQIFNIDFDLGKIARLGFNSLSLNEKEEFQDFYNRVKGFIDWKGNIEFWINEGQISLNWRFFENNEWHDILKNESSGILKYLSAGKGVSGFLANLNMNGIHQLFYDEFSGGLEELSESISSKEKFSFRVPYEIRFLEKLIQANGFDDIFDGEMAYILFDPEDIENSFAFPAEISSAAEMSLYAGIGNDFKEFLNTLIDEKAINEKISSRFSSMFANPLEINLKGKGVSLTSSNHKFDGIGPDLNKKLDYFGRKPISAFIDLKTIVENNELWRSNKVLQPALLREFLLLRFGNERCEYCPDNQLVDFALFETDMKEGNLTIHMVNKHENPLTYIINNILSNKYNTASSYKLFVPRVVRAEKSEINESTGGAYPLDQDFLHRDSWNSQEKSGYEANVKQSDVLFSAFGTEPFWSLQIRAGQLIYEDEDNEIYKTYTLLDQYRKGMYSQVLRCLNSKGNMCYLKITNKPSDDGMSEDIYPFEVILEEEGSKRYGVSRGH